MWAEGGKLLYDAVAKGFVRIRFFMLFITSFLFFVTYLSRNLFAVSLLAQPSSPIPLPPSRLLAVVVRPVSDSDGSRYCSALILWRGWLVVQILFSSQFFFLFGLYLLQ